jgi:hypothetical protein
MVCSPLNVHDGDLSGRKLPEKMFLHNNWMHSAVSRCKISKMQVQAKQMAIIRHQLPVVDDHGFSSRFLSCCSVAVQT